MINQKKMEDKRKKEKEIILFCYPITVDFLDIAKNSFAVFIANLGHSTTTLTNVFPFLTTYLNTSAWAVFILK